jgi:hypothetical protein
MEQSHVDKLLATQAAKLNDQAEGAAECQELAGTIEGATGCAADHIDPVRVCA